MASWNRNFGPSRTEEKVPEVALNNQMDGWGTKRKPPKNKKKMQKQRWSNKEWVLALKDGSKS